MNASQYTDKIFRFYMSVVLTSVRLFQSAILTEGPALMAMWSKASATVCTQSLITVWVGYPVWACEEVASDLGNRRWFSPGTPVSSTSRKLATIWHKCDEKQNSKFQMSFWLTTLKAAVYNA